MRSILVSLGALAVSLAPMDGTAADFELVGFTSATFD